MLCTLSIDPVYHIPLLRLSKLSKKQYIREELLVDRRSSLLTRPSSDYGKVLILHPSRVRKWLKPHSDSGSPDLKFECLPKPGTFHICDFIHHCIEDNSLCIFHILITLHSGLLYFEMKSSLFNFLLNSFNFFPNCFDIMKTMGNSGFIVLKILHSRVL